MELVKTKDGSNTLFHAVFDEHYHSIHGALQESMHVFIKNGLSLVEDKKTIYVFEMGFGTGLNALLAYDFAIKNNIKLHYFSIEAYPISANQANSLGYGNLIDNKAIFEQLHQATWNESHQLKDLFCLHKIEGFLEEKDLKFVPPIDVIFYDAFAPSAQEHLWATSILAKMYYLLNNDGFLTTYCAKGQFKRNLKEVGFKVKAVAGPPGKREMTLAYK